MRSSFDDLGGRRWAALLRSEGSGWSDLAAAAKKQELARHDPATLAQPPAHRPGQPASWMPTKRVASALRPVRAPKIAIERFEVARMFRKAVTPEIRTRVYF